MSGRGRALLWVAGAVALGALGTYLYRSAEWVEREVGPSAAARRNPVLALERLLNRFGARAESEDVLGRDPAAGEVLVLNAGLRSLSAARVRGLLDWVAAGERCVLTLVPNSADGDPSEPGKGESTAVWVHTNEQLWLDALAIESRAVDSMNASAVAFTATLDARPAELRVRAASDLLLYISDRWSERAPQARPRVLVGPSERQGFVLLVPHGAGWVILQTDSRWWENEAIGELDHARLALHLLTSPLDNNGVLGPLPPEGAAARVRFVTSFAFPGILRSLWTHARPLVLALGALILVGLWRATLRFGPLEPPPSRDRRDFGEHVRAAGQFQWRVDAARGLIDELRGELLTHVASAQNAGASDDELAASVADRTGVELETVRSALGADPGRDARRFTRLVHNLATIRRKL